MPTADQAISSPETGHARRRFVLGAGGLGVLALLLRLHQLGTQPLWLDEAMSWRFATMKDWGAALLAETNPPLYYLALRCWIGLFGESTAALRLPSALAGSIFVLAVIWAARELFDRESALFAGLVAALAPYHIYYSQEARCYSPLVLALILALGALTRALRSGSYRCWAAFGLAAVTAVALHYFAAFFLVFTAVPVALQRDRKSLIGFGGAALASAVLPAPWLLASLSTRGYFGHAFDVLEEIWRRTPPALAIPRSLELFAIGPASAIYAHFKQLNFIQLPFPLWLAALGAAAGLVALALGPWLERVPSKRRERLTLALLLFGPLVAMWSVSALMRPIYLVGRYDLVAFPAFAILLGRGLSKVFSLPRWRAVAPVLLLAWGGPIAAKLALYYVGEPAPGTDPTAAKTAELIDREARQGDLLVFTRDRGLFVFHELALRDLRCDEGACRQAGRVVGARVYPLEREVGLLRSRVPGAGETDEVEQYRRALGEQGRLWVVLGGAQAHRDGFRPAEDERALLGRVESLGLKVSQIHDRIVIFAPW